MKGPPAALRILLVEDNPGDVRLTREAIRASDARVEVTVAEDGEAALSLLEEKENLPSGHLPDVVLLDLNLPGMSGKDVLREVKSNTQWEHIPVTIWSSSDSPADMTECYKLKASSYLTKPHDFDRYKEAIINFVDFWSRSARLPRL